MSDTDIAPTKSEGKADRDAKGLYLPGHAVAGPGRPKGSVSFTTAAKAMAVSSGRSVEEVTESVVGAMVLAAESGDVAAQKAFLDRVCGPVDKAPAVALQVNAGTVNIAEQARADIRAMAGDDDVQEKAFDELERMTEDE